MGWYAVGEIASGTVIENFRNAFVSGSELNPRERLFQALQAANYAIFDQSVVEPTPQGMGTTLLAAVVAADALHWMSVGDSPLWLLRGQEMQSLNQDHSVGGVLDRRAHAGEITYEEASQASEHSKLLEAVMGEEIKRVDSPVAPLPLRAGDIVLLASDGVETCSCDELWRLAQAETSATKSGQFDPAGRQSTCSVCTGQRHGDRVAAVRPASLQQASPSSEALMADNPT